MNIEVSAPITCEKRGKFDYARELVNIVGKKFGRLQVIAVSQEISSRPSQQHIICVCDCGNESSPLIVSVLSGHTKSCGCISNLAGGEAFVRNKEILASIVGKRFGRLVVVKVDTEKSRYPSQQKLICQCDCGNQCRSMLSNLLKSDHSRSCGCYRREQLKENNARGHAKRRAKFPAPSGYKQCRRCEQIKLFAEYDSAPQNTFDRLRGWCRQCVRDHYLLSTYGISTEQYKQMAVNGCMICGELDPRDSRNSNLHVDHNHETGEVVGLLCAGCNKAIGLLRESPVVIEKALAYVRHKQESVIGKPLALPVTMEAIA